MMQAYVVPVICAPIRRATSGFVVLRYWVSNLRGIAVLRKKLAVLRC